MYITRITDTVRACCALFRVHRVNVSDESTRTNHVSTQNKAQHGSVYIPWLWRHNGRDGVTNNQPHHCLLNRLFGRRSKKTSKLRVTGLCAGKSPVTGEFPAQMASNAENVSIWWRHHVWDILCDHAAMLVFRSSNLTSQWHSLFRFWFPQDQQISVFASTSTWQQKCGTDS